MRDEVDAWKTHLIESEHAPNTIDSYITSLCQFFERHTDFTKADVVAYKRELMDEGKAPKTINIRIGALNQYARWAGIDCDVKTVRTQRDSALENVITVRQKDKLLEGLKRDGNENGYAMVLFLSMTGARVAELVQMQKQILQDGYQLITNKGKMRRIYAPKGLVNKVSDYYATTTGQYLFFDGRGDGSKPITTRGVASRLQRYARAYGVPVSVCHPHSFRHMFGIEFMKANGNIALLADLMGHSNVSTTQIYARMSAEEQKRQLDEAVMW